MKRKINLSDLVNSEILFDQDGELEILENGTRIVRMQNEQTEMIWKLLKKGIVIENQGDLQTILSLSQSGSGKARILSPFGEMLLPVSGVKIEEEQSAEAEIFRVFYTLNEEDPFGFELRLQNRPE